MAELKPCPFCGCAMRIHSNRDWHHPVGMHDDGCMLVDAGWWFPANDAGRADLVATWNRRATDGQRDTARGVPEGWTVERRENGDILIQSPTGDRAGVWHDDTSPLAEVVRQLFQDMMYAAPTPPDGGIPTDTIDRLTRQKATHIIARDGFQVSGVVLTKPSGDSCIVDKGAVRWLDSRQLFSVMHPDAPSAGDGELDRRDAERYRAIRACGSEWSGLRVFNSRGELDPQSLDTEADCLVAAMAAGKGEKNGR